jgi:hypothetical protein
LPPTSASVTAETGGIEGKILTDELQPIKRAQVSILVLGKNTTSAEDGSFAFSDLPAGKVTLVAAALGYRQATRSVDVVIGEIAKGDMLLENIPASMPSFEEVQKFGGTLVASDACEAGEFTPETKDVSWRDHAIVINESKDGVVIAAVLLDIDLKSVDSPTSVDVDLQFLDSAGKQIASSTTADPNEHLEHDKYIPAGTYAMRVLLCAGANVKYAATVKITYEQGDLAQDIIDKKKK